MLLYFIERLLDSLWTIIVNELYLKRRLIGFLPKFTLFFASNRACFLLKISAFSFYLVRELNFISSTSITGYLLFSNIFSMSYRFFSRTNICTDFSYSKKALNWGFFCLWYFTLRNFFLRLDIVVKYFNNRNFHIYLYLSTSKLAIMPSATCAFNFLNSWVIF
jgi:hypothetical protein